MDSSDSSLNNITSNQPIKDDTKKHASPATVGTICAIFGLIVGALGIYGLTKLLEKPQTCPTCDCPQNVINNIDYSFLQLEAKSDDNIIYSPLSIRNGLALLSAGANGKTKTEIDQVLGDGDIPKYQNIPDELSLANAVFIRDTFKDYINPSYVSDIQNNLGSEIVYDPFTSSDSLDNWVSQKTFGLIKKVGFEPTDDLEVALANALAIQMGWEHEFDTSDTYGSDFYKEDGTTIKATTMSMETSKEDIQYYSDETITALSMPLKSQSEDVNLEFVAIMPSSGLSDYIKRIDQSSIDRIISNLTPASEPKDGVIIHIPKFNFEYELNFAEDLQSLGIKSAFDEDLADFSSLATKPLYVGQAIHKANIDFSEEGIKAAAVTVFLMMDVTAIDDDEPHPIIINIDHPFLFLIRDAGNNTIWFTGAVYQPNLWADDMDDYKSVF